MPAAGHGPLFPRPPLLLKLLLPTLMICVGILMPACGLATGLAAAGCGQAACWMRAGSFWGTGLLPLLQAHRLQAELELCAREMLVGEGPRMLVVLNPANDTAQVHPHRGRRCHLELMHRGPHRLPMCEREQGTSRDAEGRRKKGGGAPTTTRRPNQLECYEVAADSPKLSYEAWCMPPARISPNDPKIYFLGPSPSFRPEKC